MNLACLLSFQGNRQRRIIYRVTSQQDSSVLQVISGPETSVQEESSGDAMHVFIDEHGEPSERVPREEGGAGRQLQWDPTWSLGLSRRLGDRET